jgi:hypothetical protein
VAQGALGERFFLGFGQVSGTAITGLARVVFTGEVPTQADIAKVIASLELQKDSFPKD